MDAQKRHDSDAFLREWTIPEEDRAKYTTQPWAGEFRWFRSPNVIWPGAISAAQAKAGGSRPMQCPSLLAGLVKVKGIEDRTSARTILAIGTEADRNKEWC